MSDTQQIEAIADGAVIQLPEAPAVTLESRRVAAEQALGDLATSLAELLPSRLALVNAPIETEIAQLTEQATTLRRSHSEIEPRVQARGRLIEREIDEAVAGGNDDAAAAKRLELKEVQDGLAVILTRAETCEQRVQELRVQLHQNARLIFDECYPDIARATRAVCMMTVTLLDSTWEALRGFQNENLIQHAHLPKSLNLPHVTIRHAEGLTPDGKDFERLLWWFGGRR